ncbi:MAG TPA: peptidoglycan DD-metalloendopeptidase family protein [Jiangellaceae bacterium]
MATWQRWSARLVAGAGVLAAVTAASASSGIEVTRNGATPDPAEALHPLGSINPQIEPSILVAPVQVRVVLESTADDADSKIADPAPVDAVHDGLSDEQACTATEVSVPAVTTAKVTPVAGIFRVSAVFGGVGPMWAASHTGLDLAAPSGRPVLAAAAGRVTGIGWDGPYGLKLEITHANGLQTWYAHLSGISVRIGQSVSAGSMIGKVGDSGNTTGPHLHLEVRSDDRPVDPQAWLEGAPVVMSAPARGCEDVIETSATDLWAGSTAVSGFPETTGSRPAEEPRESYDPVNDEPSRERDGDTRDDEDQARDESEVDDDGTEDVSERENDRNGEDGEPEAEPESDPEAGRESESEPEAEPESDPEAGRESEPEPEPESEAASEPEPEAAVEPEDEGSTESNDSDDHSDSEPEGESEN